MDALETEIFTDAAGTTSGQLNNFKELDYALIKYITNFGCRLFFLEQPGYWSDFLNANEANLEKYKDHTPEALCKIFLESVLPQVFAFDLTAHQQRMLQLLVLHPELKRVPNGYMRVPKEERNVVCCAPKLNVDFCVMSNDAFDRQNFFTPRKASSDTFTISSKQATPSKQQHHTIVLPFSYQAQRGGPNFKFSRENAILLSTALSNSSELCNYVLLKPKEIHRRVSLAKRKFEQHASMPEHCFNITQIIAKTQEIQKLRQAIVTIMEKRYL